MAGRYRYHRVGEDPPQGGVMVLPSRTPAPPSLLDAFGAARPKGDFGPVDSKNRLSVRAQVELIRMSQVGVVTTQVFQLLVLGLWCLATMVPGFSLFDGTAGAMSAFTHAGWWLLIEIVVLYIGAMAVYFGVHYNDGNYDVRYKGRIDKSGVATLQWLNSYRWVCVMGVIAHGTHLTLTWFEFADKTSTLYRSYYWCFISLLVLLFVEVILSAWQVSRVAVYYSNLYYMLNNGEDNGAMALFMTSAGGTIDDEEEEEEEEEERAVVNVVDTTVPAKSERPIAYRHGYRK